MISVVVNSLNEGEKLKRCLSSVKGWADEIIVVDMESSDKTQEVAKEIGAKIFSHKKVDYVEPVREFAVSKARSGWVLVLDPDEMVTEGLKEKLSEVAGNNLADAVKIPRLNFIFGKKIKRTNFWPDKHIRFFKKDKIRFSEMIHSYPEVSGSVLELPNEEKFAIAHYPYKNVREYMERMERYSGIEAKNLFDLGEKFSFFNLLYKPAYDFARRYFRHLGFLDGWQGFLLSFLQAYYYILVEVKLRKLGER